MKEKFQLTPIKIGKGKIWFSSPEGGMLVMREINGFWMSATECSNYGVVDVVIDNMFSGQLIEGVANERFNRTLERLKK